MSIVRLNNWTVTILDSDGNPAEGYQVKAYIDGSTTPSDTYTDISGTTAAWPLIVPSNGVLDMYIDEAIVYKFEIFKSDGVTKIRTINNISASGGGIAAGTVYTDAGDETPGYLSSKIVAGTNITVTVDDVSDPDDHKIIISAADAMLNDLQGAYDDGNEILVASDRPIELSKNYSIPDNRILTYSEDSDIPGSEKRLVLSHFTMQQADIDNDNWFNSSVEGSFPRLSLTNGKYAWTNANGTDTTDAEYAGFIARTDRVGIYNINASHSTDARLESGFNFSATNLGSSTNYVRETMRVDIPGGWSKSVNVDTHDVTLYEHTISGHYYWYKEAGSDGRIDGYVHTNGYHSNKQTSSAYIKQTIGSDFVADYMSKSGNLFHQIDYFSNTGMYDHYIRGGNLGGGQTVIHTDITAVSASSPGDYQRVVTRGSSNRIVEQTNFAYSLTQWVDPTATNSLNAMSDLTRSRLYTNNLNIDLSSNSISSLKNGLVCSEGHIYSGIVTPASVAGVASIDFSSGNFQVLSAASDATLTINLNNCGSGGSYGLIMDVQAGVTITWPVNMRWPGGTVPSFATSGEYMVTFLYTGDAFYGLSVSEAFV